MTAGEELSKVMSDMSRARWHGEKAVIPKGFFSDLARARWANISAEERTARSKQMHEAAIAKGNLGGRPRSKARCPCGEMTKIRAAKRRHLCERLT